MSYTIVKIITNEENCQVLKSLSGIYRKVFNTGLDIQFNYMVRGVDSYKEQLLSKNDFLEKLENFVKEEPYMLKIDKGVLLHASSASFDTFRQWWHRRMTFPSIKGTPRFPKYIDKDEDIFFETDTPTSVSKGYFIYLAKYGRMKIKGNVELGLYESARYFLKGDSWYASLCSSDVHPCNYFQDYVENEGHHKLAGTVEVFINEDGKVQYQGITHENTILSEKYMSDEILLEEYKERLKRQEERVRDPKEAEYNRKMCINNVKKLRNKIEKVTERMWDSQKINFNTIINELIFAYPEKIKVYYKDSDNKNCCQDFSNPHFKKSGYPFFLNLLVRKARKRKIRVLFDDSIDVEKIIK